MKSKDGIVADWLPRYTGTALADFRKYILLVNFSNYGGSPSGIMCRCGRTAPAQRDGGGDYHHQFWHGQRQRGDRHGPARLRQRSLFVSGQMRRALLKNKLGT